MIGWSNTGAQYTVHYNMHPVSCFVHDVYTVQTHVGAKNAV